MRNRILDELRKPASPAPSSPWLAARRALEHSNALGWKLLDLPAQLRISTIDSFCRDLALQQPLLSGLGGGLAIAEQPDDLYRRAARHTLEQIDGTDPPSAKPSRPCSTGATTTGRSLKTCSSTCSPSATAGCTTLSSAAIRTGTPCASAWSAPSPTPSATLDPGQPLLDQVPGAREEALELARFACTQPGRRSTANWPSWPIFPNRSFLTPDALEEAHQALLCLANLLLTAGNLPQAGRQESDFPPIASRRRRGFCKLIAASPPFPASNPPSPRPHPAPARYTEDDWQIVRACFTLLRHAAPSSRSSSPRPAPSTSSKSPRSPRASSNPTTASPPTPPRRRRRHPPPARRRVPGHQPPPAPVARRPHRRLARPRRPHLFAVGDPMQSIYFFRDADAELFRPRQGNRPRNPQRRAAHLRLRSLSANFRTTPPLVSGSTKSSTQVFAEDDGSGVTFSSAEPPRERQAEQS
jgi:ATP-dependent helicase/nuclease subunit A